MGQIYSNQQYIKLKQKHQIIFVKGVELINVPHIFHDPLVEEYLPADIKYPIRSKISNLNKFVSNLDKDRQHV